MAGNTGYSTTTYGRYTKASKFEGTREGLDKFWNMITIYKNGLPVMK
jgi:hypothetical protein